jgi:hypothetical protein
MKLTTSVFILLTTGCAIPKKIPAPEKPPEPTAFSISLTPSELSDAFEYRDTKISAQLDQLRKDFADVEKRITTLRNQISRQVKDCLCPGEMK